jgi:hypothetical protein
MSARAKNVFLMFQPAAASRTRSTEAKCDSIMARSVRRHRPQSPPAPQAAVISFEVLAPFETTSPTTWLVAPVHRQTNIAGYPAVVSAGRSTTDRYELWSYSRILDSLFAGSVDG